MGWESEVHELATRAWFGVSDDDVIATIRQLFTAEAMLQAAKLRLVRELDARGLPQRDGAATTSQWLRFQLRIAPTTARSLVTLATALQDNPVGQALADGQLNLEQAAVITRTVGEVPASVREAAQKRLIGDAAQFGPHELAKLGQRVAALVDPDGTEAAEAERLAREEQRAIRERGLHLTDLGDGRVRLSGWLPAEAAAVLRAALDSLCHPRNHTTDPTATDPADTPAPPSAAQPTAEPPAAEPAATEPANAEPAGAQTSAAEPDRTQPRSTGSNNIGPEVAEPDGTRTHTADAPTDASSNPFDVQPPGEGRSDGNPFSDQPPGPVPDRATTSSATTSNATTSSARAGNAATDISPTRNATPGSAAASSSAAQRAAGYGARSADSAPAHAAEPHPIRPEQRDAECSSPHCRAPDDAEARRSDPSGTGLHGTNRPSRNPGSKDPRPTREPPAVPRPTDPLPTGPRTADPHPTDPSPASPHPTNPHPTDPRPANSHPTNPHPTHPSPTNPHPTDPRPIDQHPTDPYLTDPRPTEPRATHSLGINPPGPDPHGPDRCRADSRCVGSHSMGSQSVGSRSTGPPPHALGGREACRPSHSDKVPEEHASGSHAPRRDTNGGADAPTPRGRDPRTLAQRRADALVEIAARALAHGDLPRTGGQRPQLIVTLPWPTLANQVGAATIDDGTPITPATVRRLACDADLLPAVLDSTGQPLDLGRTRRLVNTPLRTAVTLRDGGCAFPLCDRPISWTEIHHLKSWVDGGPTTLTNLTALCRYHHGVVHRDDWHIRINATDGHPDFYPPPYFHLGDGPLRNPLHQRNQV